MVDEGQSEPLRMAVHAGQPLEVGVVDRAFGTVAVDEVQHAVADALDDRHVDGAGVGLVGELLGAVGERGGEHLLGRLAEADREAAGARAVLGREIGRERIGLLVDEEVAVALAVQRDLAPAVTGDRGEAEIAEQRVQQLRIGRGEFDELEAVDPHRVLERGDLDAGIGYGRMGLGVHDGSVGTTRRAGGAIRVL